MQKLIAKYTGGGNGILAVQHICNASRLNANGVPLDAIREQPGHSSLSATPGYIYHPLTEKETYKLIAKVL